MYDREWLRRLKRLFLVDNLDPPYPASTRERWAYDGYQHEMSDADHRDLAAAIHALEGMAIISTRPNDLYEEMYADWERVTQEVRTIVCTLNTEVLYLSPAVAERRMPLLSWDPEE